ncbi:hypothetical protein WSS15_10690 [Acetobacter pasteurianus]|uniref:Uncharacterized protein n=3 Tax=Acetobacter pasteurianus TaxID=438 RepID=C7JBF6_ACEP3|nr:hypothetical protein [Acetobacter pasteurianus]ASC05378.1 hypothetical protein S101468_01112 [Acetobacter pasteurianus subsp. pasteurianus]QHM91293.1 hypothetical protein FCN51_06825 [Acetobacter pasteurianus]BAH98383.1 hypothetical protein APA01_02310 [Acetobacter pasteurianus IFO 3283-01]BAI01434.1 hypothetical protein APA03_02310 [Acetobacter pasteurianus IFO 3283-03]BAI04482.1 hypothetical protein APA07_02310 [Acetobacter pasteurianus IFO 3283-07]
MEKPRVWPQDDGDPITCHEKLRVLEENWQEVQDIMRDAFEDAMLMGVSEQFMRARLKDMVDSLASPKNGGQVA